MKRIIKEFQYGDKQIRLETGLIARQATAAVMASMEGTTVLATVVAKEEAGGADFFPLSVHYQEKTYAAGKIPGGFFKREGRPSEKETLTSRLIDRPIRPLFPDGFRNEVQVVITVMSIDSENDADIISMIGASAALAISGAPFSGPIGAARVGYIDGGFVLNPTYQQLENSALNLVVSGTDNAVLMVESEAKELPEDIMLDAVVFGHTEQQAVIAAINEFATEVGVKSFDWQPAEANNTLTNLVSDKVENAVVDAYKIADKSERKAALKEVKEKLIAELIPEGADESEYSEAELLAEVGKLEKNIVRRQVLDTGSRIDGRDLVTVRQISVETGLLPRTHGSALFTRGETQAIVVTTLGSERDSQIIDALEGERKDSFLLHYNFPPFCVGEAGMMAGPKRREIGHGALAKRAIAAVLPNQDDFPYAIRVVSEITESNGSSSMASVCGSSLSLMDAGVPIKAPVAGIAMGLIKDGDQFAVLTDILGDEDHLGDMDFKVAGTAEGVNALQMDIKIDGITKEIMQQALAQAKEARMHILGEMAKVIEKPREDISEFAPRMTSFSIDPEKIKDVIGKGGATIRSIIDETGVTIDISEDGVVKIGAVDSNAGDEAKARIDAIVTDPEVGQVYDGKVTRILDFGAIVSFLPNKDGLVHISEIKQERINAVSDVLEVGQEVQVKLIEIDRQGRIRLSIKQVEN